MPQLKSSDCGNFFAMRYCRCKLPCLTLRYNNAAREPPSGMIPPRMEQCRPQVIPHQSRLGNSQILMKCRDKLSRPVAGPILFREKRLAPGGLQRTASTQILSFGVSSHPWMRLLYRIMTLEKASLSYYMAIVFKQGLDIKVQEEFRIILYEK